MKFQKTIFVVLKVFIYKMKIKEYFLSSFSFFSIDKYWSFTITDCKHIVEVYKETFPEEYLNS